MKARKGWTISYLHRHRSSHSAPPQTRRSLYLALNRPILEYGCTTYHSLNSKLINRLEATQRFACRVILQDWKLTHDDHLLKADLPLWSKSRDFATLCQFTRSSTSSALRQTPTILIPVQASPTSTAWPSTLLSAGFHWPRNLFTHMPPHFGIISLVVQLNAPHSLPSSQPVSVKGFFHLLASFDFLRQYWESLRFWESLTDLLLCMVKRESGC